MSGNAIAAAGRPPLARQAARGRPPGAWIALLRTIHHGLILHQLRGLGEHAVHRRGHGLRRTGPPLEGVMALVAIGNAGEAKRRVWRHRPAHSTPSSLMRSGKELSAPCRRACKRSDRVSHFAVRTKPVSALPTVSETLLPRHP